ncbi:hypothetical protein PO909_027873 [Leuciscus waleckii]
MKQDEAADTLEDELNFIHQLKCGLKKKYQCVFEGIAKHGDSTLLNNIYTDLYITQGCSEQVNTEHEVRQIEVASRHHESQEIPVQCTNLFEAPEQQKEVRTVLTKGVAGIGKSVSVQKFVLDWAEGKENQDINFIFPLPFREMNLKEKETQSLMDLISTFFTETKGLSLTRRNRFKVLFILDGLDECRLPLNFDGNETWRDVSSPASLDVLLTNLIKGNLFPSALIWITTRPAAASKIPPDCIDRVTEIRGFNDTQKEEYFKRRFTDENQANEIIDHVKQSKSLFIMCHIPVFCWISATVLQNILEEKRNKDKKHNQSDEASKTLQESNTEDTPKTLTQMYTHFLRFQIQQSSRKYDGEYTPDVSWDEDAILSLGKLAFHQLERNNLIFYDTDLEDCGIDVYKASVYSGMCTQIFKEETGITVGTTFCFVHLSIQEFIAGLYAHLFQDINKKSGFIQEATEQENKNKAMIDLLKTAVDKALESEIGHLDLFLRFLLGLSLQSNRRLLRGLLTQQEDNDQSKKEIVQYIKQKFEDNLSPERSINLFYCLNELNDQSLVKEIQIHFREGSLSSADLSPAQWSALAFVLLTSEEEMEEFELQKFKKSDECFFRLLEVVKISKRALLSQCAVTEESCSALASVLRSASSSLKDLDLSINNLNDSGVKLLSDGLKENCKLEKLGLSNCSIKEEGYKALASALRSNPSHLIELDLTGNDPGQTGVKELNDLLQDPNCQLKTLRFLGPAADEACQYVNRVVGKNPLLLRELNLSGLELEDSNVKKLAALLQDRHCKLNILQLNNNSITEEGCSALTSAFNSNPSNLIELDLSGNKLGNSGIMSICPLLENTQCRLEKLKLSDCRITEEGYKALASALRSNPSHLIELDLTGNDPGQSGVKELNDLIQDPKFQLKTLRFLKSPAALEVCEYLTEVLGKSPLLLTELDLSEDKLGDLDGEKLSALLMDSHSKVEKIKLNNYEMTKKSCAVLATVLSKNTILKEMDLNNSRLLDSGVKEICEGLKTSKLKILKLSNCSITEEGYKALASALRSNPSHLIELDLTGNDPGKSGVKELNDLLQDQNCQLKTLGFLAPAADEACQYVRGIVGKNLLLLRELNLSDRELGDSNVKNLVPLLQEKHCKLNTLMLNNNSITEEGCSALTSAVNSNPSNLIELDLSGNKLGNSGIMSICPLLKNTQCRLEKLKLSNCSITEEGCSAVTSALKSNPSHLRELDLIGNKLGDSGVKNLSDLLMNPQCKLEKLHLWSCSITEKQCLILTSALKSNPSHLRELDLRINEIRNTGVNHLCDVLKDSHCKLERLSLGYCKMTDEGCSAVTSALKSNPSHLRELDLSENKLGDSGVKNLSDLLMNPQCKLEKLDLCECSITEKQCLILTSALKSNPSHLRELDLSINEIRNTGVNHLCDVLKDSHCKMERLSLCRCSITEEQCLILTSALKSNPSHLRELNLSENQLGDSGVKNLSDLLMIPQCKLEKLELSDCRITEEGFKALASALRSNPSHLIELDLTGNDPGQSGVKELNDLLQDQNCQLETLRFLGPAADEACQYVRGIVGKSPLLLRYLDLSGHELGDTRVNQISALLQDKHCKLNTLNLCKCSITEKQCLILTSALKSNPSHLRKLNLSVNEIRNTGVNNLCDVLKDSHCKLERLSLGYCKMTDEGCSAVTSALKSNPSHLRELDLIGNKLGDSGVKNLSDLLMIPQCKLEKLDLLSCSITEKQCLILTSALKSNPSHLRELILSWNEIRNTGVNHLGDVLKDSLCKLEILRLSGCKMTDGGCSPVTSALKSNPSHLRELNLSRNKLGDSGVKNLSDLLMSPQCKLEKLWLWECSITEKQCLILTSALKSNPSHLRKLILSENKIENTGVNHLCDLLKDSHCKLEILRLSNCSITEEGYKALASALRSNPSHLIELDLTGNYPGQSGVKELNDLLQDPKFQLKTLRVLSPAAEAACQYVTGILGKSLLFLRELNLSGHELGDTRVNQISALLQDKHCKLNTLNLCGCSITEKQCLILTSALKSNPSHLRELDLSINKIENTGVNHLCDILKDSHCKLEILRLSCCNMTGEGCSAVTSALKSNPSHLRELELSGNKLGDSGVKNLSDLLMNPQCKLEKLHLRECSITEKQCLILTSALKSNPSHLRKLNLRKNKIENTGVNHLCDVLKDSHCKLERLSLNDCGITDVSALTQSLTNSNALQFLKELDLRNNMIRDSKQLRDVIRDSNCTLR